MRKHKHSQKKKKQEKIERCSTCWSQLFRNVRWWARLNFSPSELVKLQESSFSLQLDTTPWCTRGRERKSQKEGTDKNFSFTLRRLLPIWPIIRTVKISPRKSGCHWARCIAGGTQCLSSTVRRAWWHNYISVQFPPVEWCLSRGRSSKAIWFIVQSWVVGCGMCCGAGTTSVCTERRILEQREREREREREGGGGGRSYIMVYM